MAKAKKGSRTIVVGDVTYRWRITAEAELSLVVWPEELPGSTISCVFDFRRPQGTEQPRELAFTNRIVRQVIEYAIRKVDYDPHAGGRAQVKLHPRENEIDLYPAAPAR